MSHLQGQEAEEYRKALTAKNLPPDTQDYPRTTTTKEAEDLLGDIESNRVKLGDGEQGNEEPALRKGCIRKAVGGGGSVVASTKRSFTKTTNAIPSDTALCIEAFDLGMMLSAGEVDLSKCGEVLAEAASSTAGPCGRRGHGEGHDWGRSYDYKAEKPIALLDNGCLCYTVREDLVKAIKNVVQAAQQKQKANKTDKALDGILIETTGIADPGPICKTFYGDAVVCTYCKIDGVLTVVDAVHFIDQLTRDRSEGSVNESAQQVAFADKVLLNKVDLATPEKLEQTIEAVRGVNSFVPITKCSLVKTPDTLLSIDAFDLGKMLDAGDVDLSKCGEVVEEATSSSAGHGGPGGHEEGHDCGHGHGEDCDHAAHGGATGHRHGSGHGHGHGHGHGEKFRHDTAVGSFVCELNEKPIDRFKFQMFMKDLLEHSEDLYRMKGFLAMRDPMAGQIVKQVIQGVHDIIDMDDGGDWPSSQPVKSQLVLIGRRLDRKKWTEMFASLAG